MEWSHQAAGDRACHCLYTSSGEEGRPCIRVQGQVDVLCLLPSPKLSRLPSCPQRGFQLQTSLRADKVVTDLLWAPGYTSEWAGDLQGLLQKDRMQTGRWCACVSEAHGIPKGSTPPPLVLLPTVFQQFPAFAVPGAELCKMPTYPTKKAVHHVFIATA